MVVSFPIRNNLVVLSSFSTTVLEAVSPQRVSWPNLMDREDDEFYDSVSDRFRVDGESFNDFGFGNKGIVSVRMFLFGSHSNDTCLTISISSDHVGIGGSMDKVPTDYSSFGWKAQSLVGRGAYTGLSATLKVSTALGASIFLGHLQNVLAVEVGSIQWWLIWLFWQQELQLLWVFLHLLMWLRSVWLQ